jgi:hypothetical protein
MNKIKPNRFKVLTYLGNYVDERLLPQGLYTTIKPVLHDEEETISNLIKLHEDFYIEQDISIFDMKKTIENIKKCSLTLVEVNILK